jgi:16S rRNA (guanine527-N7)-methyltransferase
LNPVAPYFPEFTAHQFDQLAKLGPLYRDWNEKINVISRKDIDQLYLHHVLHSLAIAKFIRFKPGTRILDAGTGGGFPGIPLAIAFPEAEFTLADSIGKKITVVNAVASETGLQNVRTFNGRVENITGTFDFVVSRAVTSLPEFVGWIRGKISRENRNALPNGIIYLKGGDLESELRPFAGKARTTDISSFFGEEFFETKKIIFVPMS